MAPGLDGMAVQDPAAGQAAKVEIPDSEARPVMQLQVVLDRLGFTPGVIDGKQGASTRNALVGFQEANGLATTGEFDAPTKQALARWNNIQATRVVTIPAEFAQGPFHAMPAKPEEQAKMPALGYISLDEKLAERFHTTVAALQALNPGGMPAGAPGTATREAAASESASPTVAPSNPVSSASFAPQPGPAPLFHASQQVRVPNTGSAPVTSESSHDAQWGVTLLQLGVGSEQPKVDKIVVSKSKGTLRAYDKSGKLVGIYTATMGSSHDPLPLGSWKVNGVARNPPFHYNPKLFWDSSSTATRQTLPPGPNGPVGVVWIDLNKDHYGIHGTPQPQTIGRAESHGCVRLTNWDAARLAQMVSPGTQVRFEP